MRAWFRPASGHQVPYFAALTAGLKRHGIEVVGGPPALKGADFAVSWGWREGKKLRALGHDVLVIERGYVGDRTHWTSLGWNGLNGRAQWNSAGGNGKARFDKHFASLVKPWKPDDKGYALIVGQVRGDAALEDVDIERWYLDAALAMKSRGFEIAFRPHPVSVARRSVSPVLAAQRIGGTLQDALAGAAVAVTWNSNTGVEAVLAGVPVIACDEGAMAWPVSSHGADAPLLRPDRDDWCRDMAWRQWTVDEISSGFAWDHVRQRAPAPKLKRCLVIGGAGGVWDEIEQALDLSEFEGVIACNDAGAVWRGPLAAWVTLHPSKMAEWQAERAARGLKPTAKRVVAHEMAPGITSTEPYRWPEMNHSGSSGHYAAKVALGMGFDRVVLCGVPMDPAAGHFFDTTEWTAAAQFRAAWTVTKTRFDGRVRSMGGWTAKLLGKPTPEWLAGVSGA